MNDKVLVNKIILSSSVDGPGNRTVIFLQGCNMNCKYCHNPETIALCKNCGKCASLCPSGALYLSDGKVHYDKKECVHCDACLRACSFHSSPKTQWMTPEDVMQQVRPVIPFIRGITVSGGEATLQRDFIVALFTLAKSEGLTCFLDTNGQYDFKEDPHFLSLIDGVMLDIKAWSKEEHLKLTGAGNDLPVQNLVDLAEENKLYEVRTVVAPTQMNAAETVYNVSTTLKKIGAEKNVRYKLISYRPMGVRGRYKKQLSSPAAAEMEALATIAKENGMADVNIV